jgi:hypothetical protein
MVDWEETFNFVLEYGPLTLPRQPFTSSVTLDNYEVALSDATKNINMEIAFARLVRPEIFNSNMDFMMYRDSEGYVPLDVLASHPSLIGFSDNAIYEMVGTSQLIEKKYNTMGLVVRPRGFASIFIKNSRTFDSYFNPCTKKLIAGVNTQDSGWIVSFGDQES